MALLYYKFSGVTCGDISSVRNLYWPNASGVPVVGNIVTDNIENFSVLPGYVPSNTFGSFDVLVYTTAYSACPGLTARPFAYNPTQLNISGTYNIGTLCVGVDVQNYSSGIGGLNWWNGPNENEGYCIGTVVTAQNQSTPFGNIGNVKFWRTNIFTDASFLDLVKTATGQTFTNTPDACVYLESNNYWTSYDGVSILYFLVSNRTSKSLYAYRTNPGNEKIQIKTVVIPNTTPAYTLYQKTNRYKTGIPSTELTHNYVGSPAKYANSIYNTAQYKYGKEQWLTDVWVYTDNTNIAYLFPYGGTATWGELVYQNIVNPYI
jgi:hypothetical protein